MYKVEANGPNRLDLEFGGKIDSDEMKAALDEMISKSENIENGRMLYRMKDIDMPTLGAMGVEFSRLPELFRMAKKFDRAAVLSDKKWIQVIGEIEGALFPGLDIRSFDYDEVAEAEAWLAS
jgi:hypothetical protein